MLRMFRNFVLLLYVWGLYSSPIAQAETLPRPPISGYFVHSLQSGGKMVLHASATAAGSDYCRSRNFDSSGPDGQFTGTHRWQYASPKSPDWYQVACEYQRYPKAGEPIPAPEWKSDATWQIHFYFACKNNGDLFDSAPACLLPADRPPQPSQCQPGGANEHGNPIDFSSGQKLRREADYQGSNGLHFTRQYMSNPLFDGFAPHWRHNFDLRMFSNLFLQSDNARSGTYVLDNDTKIWGSKPASGAGSPGIGNMAMFPFRPVSLGVLQAYFTRDDGYYLFFTSKDQGKTWATDSDVNYKLSGITPDATYPKGRWQLETPSNDKEIYDGSNGVLLEIRYHDGRVHTLSYHMADTTPTTLRQVTDNFGRSLQFVWGGNNVLVKLIDPDQQEFLYGYDQYNLLTSVTYPDGLSRIYHYDEAAYSTPTHRSMVDGYLTGISDEVQAGRMIRWGIFKYNAKGLPVSTELAGGAEKYQFDYDTGSMTDPLGTVRKVGYVVKNGIKLQSSLSQPAGAGCAPAATKKTYDDNTNLISTTDYNGAVTQYTYYPGNLLKSKTQGVGSTDQRTTSYEWHPSLRLPVKVAEPKLLTLYEYDSNGNLTGTSEQATLDATGAQGLTPTVTGPVRKSSATYNAVGQILTKTEFVDGIEQTTRFQYNPLDGNLDSVTDEYGLTTRFSNFNAHGDVGRIEYPEGDITDFTYYPRRWVKSISRHTNHGDTLTTTFDYDSRGHVVRENRPHGGIKIVNYDDAGRLINVADNIDNSLDYTLDLMGNRLLEQVRDPKGNLIKQIRRTVDPLGRMQQAVSGKTAPVQDVPTTTNLASTDNPVRVGYPLRVTATVSGDLPTGEVVFMEGTTRLAVQFLHDGKAMVDISNLPLGNHALTAFYSGDNKNHPSTSTTLVQVIQAGTASTITLTCPALSTVESTLTCSASMRAEGGYSARLSGQALKLREGNTVLATGVLKVADGVASTQLSMTGLAVGEHRFQVFYAGDAILLPNQSNLTSHTVQSHAPQITRLSLTGPLDVGAIYEVALPGLANGTGGYATYTVAASDTSLSDIARHLAESVQAVTAYQVKANGPTLTITGPDKVTFTVVTSVRNRPILSEGDFFQQALAPRPGTSAHFGGTFDLNGEFGKNTTGAYDFSLSFVRQNSSESRSVMLEGYSRPINTENALSELCIRLRTAHADMDCFFRKEGHYLTLDFSTPIGQTEWQASGSYYDSKGSLDLQLHLRSNAESTVLEPQPQIISMRPLGKAYSGVVYSVTAGSETWRYTSNAQDTEATILNGLATAVSSSQQYVPKVVTARYGILNLQIASKTPVLPFTYSFTISNYLVTIDATLVQAAR